ncbi:hypothetical protein BGX38DRAFT_1195881 [Terfezia claveryi]|nr:hypothetical protein BGX38DRAFT_1195881 [Terfezia claveryi]
MATDVVPISAAGQHMGKLINVIGVVVDLRSPTLTQRDEYMITFILCDKTKSLIENGLTVRYFHRMKDDLPEIQGLNDIVVLRNVKMTEFGGKNIAISHFTSSWIVGYQSPIRKEFTIKSSGFKVKATSSEMVTINTLREFWKSRGGAASSRGVNPMALPKMEAQNGYKRKFAHIKDLQYDHFYDLMGEVVKTFPGNGSFTIYLTDYTRNLNLHCYEWPNLSEHRKGSSKDDRHFYTGSKGDCSSKWPGPFGQYTLQITLWEVHADAARKIVRDGCLLNLKNVRAKRNADGKMEGALHGDRKFPDRVDISVVKDLKDPLVALLSRRKVEYKRRSESERLEYEEALRKQVEDIEEREQEEKKEAEKLNENIITRKANGVPSILVGDILNPVDINLKETPYVNRNYRTICRVVDFLPHKLEQFCVRKEVKPKATHSKLDNKGQVMNVYSDGSEKPAFGEEHDHEGDDDDVPESQRKEWEFKFALLVEGEDGATMRLMVDDKSAQFLLKMDATDLKADPCVLAELREKLYILWGDLEERKSRKLKRLDMGKRGTGREPDSRKRKSTPLKQHSKKRRRSNKNGDEDCTSGDSDNSDEDGNGLIVGRSKYFAALVREYGVKRTSGEGEVYWQRMFGLFGVMIKY